MKNLSLGVISNWKNINMVHNIYHGSCQDILYLIVVNMSSSWAMWLVIIVMLLACLGIIIWFAIDNNVKEVPHQGVTPVVK